MEGVVKKERVKERYGKIALTGNSDCCCMPGECCDDSSNNSPPPPSDTSITSAVDGNGVAVQNGGTTLSTSITFTFTARQGTNLIAGFQCSLDGSQFSSCTTTNPGTVTLGPNLAVGKHTFQVVAVDSFGLKDPNPATFSWTIIPGHGGQGGNGGNGGIGGSGGNANGGNGGIANGGSIGNANGGVTGNGGNGGNANGGSGGIGSNGGSGDSSNILPLSH